LGESFEQANSPQIRAQVFEAFHHRMVSSGLSS
jgi:hypothetical protein